MTERSSHFTMIQVLSESAYASSTTKSRDDILHFVEFPINAYVVDSYISGTSGYVKYSNRYIVQWGRVSRTAAGVIPVSFLERMAGGDYNVSVTLVAADSYTASSSYNAPYVGQPTNTGFNFVCPAAIANIPYADWTVIGRAESV